MNSPPHDKGSSLTPKLTAPQQKPRPLPLFLELLRREAAADPALMAAALKGLRDYQDAPRPAPMPIMPAVAEAHGATLRDYGGSGRPVLFVPSLINPPSVLDLSEERSLLRWLAARGHHVLLLDWGNDALGRRDLSIAGHVEQILLPFIRGLDEPPVLAGYCLGGTMAIAATARAPVAGLALIAAPWHFDGFPAASRDLLDKLWHEAAPAAEAMGVLPMELLQSAFWSLDPARTVAKFAEFGRLAADDPKRSIFVVLEDWANDGPPLPFAAARELFDGFFGCDLPGKGAWQLGGRAITPSSTVPVLNIVSTSDRIVPEASAARIGGEARLAQGHVGMVVGSRAPNPLRERLHAWLLTVAQM